MKILIEKVRTKHKHGLLLYTILHKIGQKGVRVYPYYLMKEGIKAVNLPEFKGNIEEYTFDFLNPSDVAGWEEIEELKEKEPEFLQRLESGKKCFCARHKGKIIAYSWFDFKECRFLDPLFTLKEKEVYLFDMYTLQSYRGKNLAPYLRKKSYEALNKMGLVTLYSISEFFNTPAVKFKRKLNVIFLGLYINIDLFRKKSWNLKIREYKS